MMVVQTSLFFYSENLESTPWSSKRVNDLAQI